jgi:hypothetical protein
MGYATTSIALGAALVLGASACSGIDAGVDYPSDLPGDLGPQLITPENGPDPAIRFSQFKIAPDACKGIDTHPIHAPLTPDDLSRFLEGQGVKITAKKARGNLYWYDFPNGREPPNNFVRLRLAILDDSAGAAKDLHASLLEHGPGWWGVRRSNLAVLAPKASLHDALAFALKYKLPCWGVFTMAGNDDAYVVTGPYSEL